MPELLTFANEMRLNDALEVYIPQAQEEALEGFVSDATSNIVSTLKKPLDAFTRGLRTVFNARPGVISAPAIEKAVVSKKYPFDWFAISELTIPQHLYQSEDGEKVAETLYLLSRAAEDIAKGFLPSVVKFYRYLARNPEALGLKVTPAFPDAEAMGIKLNDLTERYYDCFGASTNRSGVCTVNDNYERLGEVYNSIEHTNQAVKTLFDNTNPKEVEKLVKELNRIVYGLVRVGKEYATDAVRKELSAHVYYCAQLIEFYGVLTATVVAQQKIMAKTVEVITEAL